MGVKEGSRGQITIIVILALVILFIFAFLIYIRGILYINQVSFEADKQLKSYMDQNSINQYITSCLDYISDEAILRVSMQGGIMNFTGMHAGVDYVTRNSSEFNRTFNISIVAKTNTVCPYVENYNYIPEYPYPDTTVGDPPSILIGKYRGSVCGHTLDTYLFYSGFFGYNNMTKLCNATGANRKDINIQTVLSCEKATYSTIGGRSVQVDMEKFISNEMSKCVNFSSLQSKTGANITLLNSTPNVTVIFGTLGMIIDVQYPFLIIIGNRPPIMKMAEFSYNKNIAFKELYDYAYFALMKDVNDATFNFIRDKTKEELASMYRGYDIIRNISDDNATISIVRIKDDNTLIYGKPLSVQFAIRNRRPALEHMAELSTFHKIHILVAENETFTLTPQGYDPDDDSLVYNYSGWKENYDEWYNYSDDDCNTPTSLAYVIANCSIKNYSSTPHNFTNNMLYNQTKQNTTYKARAEDRGYHELKIYTIEQFRERLDDYQIVKIFVFDTPKAVINTENFFTDIPDDLASYEDPFLFNGTASTLGLSSLIGQYAYFTYFIWNDTAPAPGEFYVIRDIHNETDKVLLLPNYFGNATIMNITLYPFRNRTAPPASLLHNISLTVITQIGINHTAYETINVTQCLPHRSNNSIYPYNAFPFDEYDAYQANHTCCDDDHTYKLPVQSCFLSNVYGGNFSFINYTQRQPLPTNVWPTYLNILSVPPLFTKADNDVFFQVFNRRCSANRGNICNGFATETRTVINRCVDNNYINNVTFQNERCSGPATTGLQGRYLGNFANNISNNVVCVNYSSYTIGGNAIPMSFERIAFLRHNITSFGPPATNYDGYCTTSAQCATGNYFPGLGQFNAYSGGTTGRYSCVGTCGGNGQCRPTNCVCNNNQCSQGGGNTSCNGLSGSGAPNPPSCNAAGSTLFADTCANCGLVESVGQICRSPAYGIGCTADANCDNVPVWRKALNDHSYCTDRCIFSECGLYNYNETTRRCYNFEAGDNCVKNPDVCSELSTCCTQKHIDDGQCIEEGNCFINIGPITP